MGLPPCVISIWPIQDKHTAIVFHLNNITNAFDNYTPLERAYVRILY